MKQTEIDLKASLIVRGFSEKTLINNRGLIGAVVETLQVKHEEELKKAVIDAYKTAQHKGHDYSQNKAEQYYNETFKQ